MSEHEQLKEICDKIGIGNKEWSIGNFIWEDWYYCVETHKYDGSDYTEVIDVRQIIFTPEFMEKLNIFQYWDCNPYTNSVSDFNDIMLHLDKPVQYLYDIFK